MEVPRERFLQTGLSADDNEKPDDDPWENPGTTPTPNVDCPVTRSRCLFGCSAPCNYPDKDSYRAGQKDLAILEGIDPRKITTGHQLQTSPTTSGDMIECAGQLATLYITDRVAAADQTERPVAIVA